MPQNTSNLFQQHFIYLNTGYNNGGNENLNDATIMKVGSLSTSKPVISAIVYASGTTESIHKPLLADMVKVTVPEGNYKHYPTVNWAYDQTTSSPISGCDATFVPNYGQGAQEVQTIWPTDTERTAPAAEYLIAGKEQFKNFKFQGQQ